MKYCLFLLWIMVCITCLTLYYVSHDAVYEISVCMCVKQQTDDLYTVLSVNEYTPFEKYNFKQYLNEHKNHFQNVDKTTFNITSV